jgi:3-oxoacyl-[acyl-carrier protein] reductase
MRASAQFFTPVGEAIRFGLEAVARKHSDGRSGVRGVGSRTMVNMSNKVAIVTGAFKGIGGGIATALGAAGARVAVNYSFDREGAERVAQAITDNGGEAIAVGADVSKAADVARLFKEVHSAFGRLDVLVNNAGVFRFGAFAEITEASFQLHYNINVLGAILTVQEAIKRFGTDGGSIINLSSIVGSHPVAGARCTLPRKAPSKR